MDQVCDTAVFITLMPVHQFNKKSLKNRGQKNIEDFIPIQIILSFRAQQLTCYIDLYVSYTENRSLFCCQGQDPFNRVLS